MRNVVHNRIRLSFLFAIFCLLAQLTAFAQQRNGSERLDELRRLRDQLQLTDAVRGSDVLIVMNERVLAEAARQLIGLEVVLSNGSTIRVTSIESELKTAAAMVKIGLQAKSSVTVNLQLIGRINSGELDKDSLRLPIRVTEVKLANGLFSSMLIKTIFGDWLKPETWNDELPAIELPLELTEAMRIPASKFDVAGELPMEISTPAFQPQLKFALTSLFVLDKRAVLALRMNGAAVNVIQTSYTSENNNDPIALEREIESMAKELNGAGDLRIRLGRRVLGELLVQLAAAQPNDFDIRLKQGRVRTEEVNAIVNITNYTDVESGQGRADISAISIDRIADGRIQVRMNGQGEIDAKLRGREYGIPYSLSPHITFAIKDQMLPMLFANDGDRVILRALPGASFPIDLRISAKVAGRDVGINRAVAVQADRWLNRIELPAFFGREIPLPRRVEVDVDGNWQVAKTQKLNYTITNLRLNASDDALDIVADVKLSTP
jgi:hypothetical protein